jgi:hypothetical protein
MCPTSSHGGSVHAVAAGDHPPERTEALDATKQTPHARLQPAGGRRDCTTRRGVAGVGKNTSSCACLSTVHMA